MTINSFDDFLLTIRELNKAQQYQGFDHDNEWSQALNELIRTDRQKYLQYQKRMEKNFKKSHKADMDIDY